VALAPVPGKDGDEGGDPDGDEHENDEDEEGS
jgi:hypothetical protein